MDHLKMYFTNEWKTQLVKSGILQLMSLIQSYYLNNYEQYLIRNIYKEGTKMPIMVLKRYLDDYYKFLALCGLKPLITKGEDF